MLRKSKMPTTEKELSVQELEKQARECKGLMVAAFKGLKTVEFNELRLKLRSQQSECRVVKNSLTRIALKNAGIQALADALEGPTAIVIQKGDATSSIKTVFEFAKTHENIKIRGGYLDGQVLSGAQLKEIAGLPSREVLLSILLGTLQSPLVNLVSVMQAPMRDLVNVLDAISKKSEGK
jgi:large subunit ribosomal protein L10